MVVTRLLIVANLIRKHESWEFPQATENHAEEQAEWDKAAEYDITGGFAPTNVCAICHTARSISGECLCT